MQGRNADALILYFGEDPARCPFEQGWWNFIMLIVIIGFVVGLGCKVVDAASVTSAY